MGPGLVSERRGGGPAAATAAKATGKGPDLVSDRCEDGPAPGAAANATSNPRNQPAGPATAKCPEGKQHGMGQLS